MQPGSITGNRGNNTHATSHSEPIDIDQASVRSVDFSSAASLNEDFFTPPQSPGNAAYNPTLQYNLEPHQMGQSASTSRSEPVPDDVRSATNREGVGATREQSPEMGTHRRSRRIRNHMEHITRLGNRFMPTPSSPNPSSPPVSNSSRNVPGLIFRSRSARNHGGSRSRSRSRSRSPDRVESRGLSASSSLRRRPTRTATSPPVLESVGNTLDAPAPGPDMMDISPVSSPIHRRSVV